VLATVVFEDVISPAVAVLLLVVVVATRLGPVAPVVTIMAVSGVATLVAVAVVTVAMAMLVEAVDAIINGVTVLTRNLPFFFCVPLPVLLLSTEPFETLSTASTP